MRLGVVGSRDLVRVDLLDRLLDTLLDELGIEVIISGGARGTDREAERWAAESGIPILSFRPVQVKGRWYVDRVTIPESGVEGHHVLDTAYPSFAAAAFTRNGFIVDASTDVVAMWDGRSTGTKDSIRKAEAAGKLRELVRF